MLEFLDVFVSGINNVVSTLDNTSGKEIPQRDHAE